MTPEPTDATTVKDEDGRQRAERSGGMAALILAGGRGRRMGGEDKGLLPLHGRPLIEHVLAAVRPQVDAVMINANRNRERYAAYGHPVIADALADFQGPLAGFAAGMAASPAPFLLTLPCDGPWVAPDMAARLRHALDAANADVAVAHDGRRMQPVHALVSCALLPDLQAFLEAGERKIDRWYARQHTVTVDFSDSPGLFTNLNTPDDRARVEQEGGTAARHRAGGVA